MDLVNGFIRSGARIIAEFVSLGKGALPVRAVLQEEKETAPLPASGWEGVSMVVNATVKANVTTTMRRKLDEPR